MTDASHTFGTKCRLAPLRRKPIDNDLPPLDAQFFYSSLLPIDDYLSGGGLGSHDSRPFRRQLRPFSRGDNAALESAWLSLESENDCRLHQAARSSPDPVSPVTQAVLETRSPFVRSVALKHLEKHHSKSPTQSPPSAGPVNIANAPCCSGLIPDIAEELEIHFCGLFRKQIMELDIENIVRDVSATISHSHRPAETSPATNPRQLKTMASDRPRRGPDACAVIRGTIPEKKSEVLGGKNNDLAVMDVPKTNWHLHAPSCDKIASSLPSRPNICRGNVTMPVSGHGISGQPFVQVGNADDCTSLAPSSVPYSQRSLPESPLVDEECDDIPPIHARGKTFEFADRSDLETHENCTVDIVVGVSRLHKVSLPVLQMKPIYWSPVNDIAVVMRATWFYRDTMVPVAPATANQLEAGYHELRPWTETWTDEINCALEVGSLGEEKVSHLLWPRDFHHRQGSNDQEPQPRISSDPFCAARCFHGEAAAQGSIHLFAEREHSTAKPNRPFARHHVIYKDKTQAYLLKPNLKPSAYYGRTPLQKIMKGIAVGIPVIRGFDRQTWDRVQDKDQTPIQPSAPPRNLHENGELRECPACKAENELGEVSDLIFVAHGIGQKFAERVDSFHFTHAINTFRRAVNMELASPIVQRLRRADQHGLMILPLNWRMGLSFEDNRPLRKEDNAGGTVDSFGLKDIEPHTIPAVRSMISDIMFDIPFYMSHHKSKMIKALVSEANRVYRLWCHNNPGFADKGRVHLIAHSLGSAMALDVLSRQPTTVPGIDMSRRDPDIQHFEFDTKNLFLLGSPAGFFLLLERGALMPRRGRRKPGVDPCDTASHNIMGDAGAFGCLAVDNIYNILAKEDPIAYLLNGSVDPTYSVSLKTAYVPSTSTSIFKAFGDAVRNVLPGMSTTPNILAAPLDRPVAVQPPSQLELEVHDFTREEIAERKAFLLNDNGQIDWFLRSGSGPLEIQYLNMLSAHTSYWTNQDFIRMLCVEIAREPGRDNTLPAMRAVKMTRRFSPAR
ncbi:hypothetical protein CDD83_1611 [Cordyceps sp. RAO-2017]|nr:hypothetical protein CDD83_1611 [Cordyceps sp. RAO-2017]